MKGNNSNNILKELLDLSQADEKKITVYPDKFRYQN